MADRCKLAALLLVIAATGCERADELTDGAVSSAASAVEKKGRQLADSAASATREKIEDLGAEAGAYVDRQLRQWLKEATDGSLEAALRDGHSTAADVVQLAKAVSGAVSSDTTVLPIYRPAGDAKKVDEQISGMPRTEVIDGVTVGFKQVRTLSNDERVTDDAYLVLWRRDDKIVGFVYQRRSRIDIDALVKETPKLMRKLKR